MATRGNPLGFASRAGWLPIALLVAILVADPSLAAGDEFFPADAMLERVWGEGIFTEGPAQGPDGCIYFSDIGNSIMKYDPAAGTTSTYRRPSGGSNGLEFDPQGRLLAAEGAGRRGNRRVSITDRDGTVRTLADRWHGKRLNGPNDLTVDPKGRVYFTDPRHDGSGARAGANYVPAAGSKEGRANTDPRPVTNGAWEIDTESVYRVELDGTVTQIVVDVEKPNGILLSPDMTTLYVADTSRTGKRQLLAFPVRDDGSLGPKKVLVDFAPDRGIDGMCIDTKGRIFAAAGRGATGGIHVISPVGERLAFLSVPENVTNCTFGGSDGRTLYVTAGRSLYRIRTAVDGFAVFRPAAN